ncbi:hypothetical protein [Blastococcus goldschmidtiae]|uniref:Uncharacterized protein n=1 Tax=Blastococcus goldschmidtiae TaxID=3075546 RepID=A0ABU2K7G6_9ACTN|nr:hypothetical protein [Blastococcus sp. DSM 46792]MDT0276134.1 hypothetical protein [Blastococcus sp. DSM 46792]
MAVDSIGDAGQLALYTFVAAIVGSVLWNMGIAKLNRALTTLNGHPDWPAFIDQAKQAVRDYEQYKVVTYKGTTAGGRSPFDADHTVPSTRWGAYLHERVDERERKAAEMSFRVTLAVALVPIAIALGVEGGRMWWWFVAAVPFVWLDVALIKYTTLRTVRRYETEDLQSELESKKTSLGFAEKPGRYEHLEEEQRAHYEAQRLKQVEGLRADIDEIEARLQRLNEEAARRLSRLFALLEGEAAG